ncbi:AsmA-like C-terminal region-containing protein [Roseiconus nitratireducens]|uniref:AsmA-like C-terminal region-containing protein n=1 Tax=Roseiconus nitratireducens TaxID=2605748 RepID=UPI001376206C|nr:AsmA-like C-terminal region-containing protein [Roseiconus nitratireducens]
MVAQNAPAGNYRYWSSNWSFEAIDLQALTRRIQSLGIPVPVRLAGKADINFDVSVPWNALRTAEAYKFKGTFAASNLRVDDVLLTSLQADVDYAQGVLKLNNLRGAQTDGKFNGSATAQLVPSKDFQATIQATNFDIGAIANLLQKFELIPAERPIRGAVSAAVQASGQVDQLRSPEMWEIGGDISSQNVTIGDSLTYSLAVQKFQLRDQRLSVPDLRLTASELPGFYLNGSAEVPLDGENEFQFDIQTNDLPATDLVGLYFDSPKRVLDGKLDLQAGGKGRFTTPGAYPEFEVDAAVASPSIRLFGVDLGMLEHDIKLTPSKIQIQPRRDDAGASDLQIQNLTADYAVSEQAIELKDLDSRIFGGTLQAEARVIRSGDGEHRLNAEWTDISPRIRLPTPVSSVPLTVVATTSGTVQWSVPPDHIDDPFFHRGTASIQVAPLRIGDETAGDADIRLAINDQGVDLNADANLFGGRVHVETTSPMTASTQWRDLPALLAAGQITLADVSIRRLTSLASRGVSRFDGRVSGQIQLRQTVEGPWAADSQLEINGWTSGNQLLSRGLRAQLTAMAGGIELSSISGTYAGGQLQAEGRWSLQPGPRLINFRLTRADADRVLLPISPRADQWFGGMVSGRGSLVGNGDSLTSVRVTGSLAVENGETFGFPVGDAHTSFHGQFSAAPYRWAVAFPSINADLARGRVKGRLEFASTSSGRSGYHMDSRWRATHVEFESLLSAYVGTSTIGRGDLTGDMTLTGRNIHSLRDLDGEYRVRLGGTDATAVPGLSAAGSLLGASSLAGARFTSGASTGRISRGSLVIDSLAMSADRVAVTAAGRVGLENRQMDVLTVLSTGNFTGQNQLIASIGTQALLDFAFIGQINRIVSDRTLVFELAGPTRDPIIRLLPAETLQANVRRFAVQEALGLVIADSIIFD